MTRPSPITEDRIRERAYLLWIEEGQPQGRAAEHWEKARELLALEADLDEGRPVEEEAVILEDQGEQEFPKKRPTASKRRPKVARNRPM